MPEATSRFIIFHVSVEEIKRSIASLSPAEQQELTAFLFHLRHANDAAYQQQIESRLSDRDPSHWLTPEEFENRLNEE